MLQYKINTYFMHVCICTHVNMITCIPHYTQFGARSLVSYSEFQDLSWKFSYCSLKAKEYLNDEVRNTDLYCTTDCL